MAQIKFTYSTETFSQRKNENAEPEYLGTYDMIKDTYSEEAINEAMKNAGQWVEASYKATKTEVHPGSVGSKKGWAFSVYYGGRDYPNVISALYKTKLEAQEQLTRYLKTGKLDTYGSAEIEIKKKGKHLGDSKNKGRHLGYSEMAKKVIKIGDKVLVNAGKYKNEEGKVIGMGLNGNNYKIEFSDGSKAIIFPMDLKLKESKKENKLASELSQGLLQFTGTENYYKHWLGNYVYTDGIKFLAEKAEAHWLIDAIFSYHRTEPFQIWELVVKDASAVLTMKEDTDQPLAVKQKIKFTDFPLDYIKLYLIDNVLLLPSEY